MEFAIKVSNFKNTCYLQKITLLMCIIILFSQSYASAGNCIINYSFEDWQGDNGNSSPAPGYIYSSAYEAYWQRHINSTEVVSGDAFHGNYYQHIQFNTTIVDPLLGRTATSVNASNTIGYNGVYPTGAKNTTRLSTDITSNTLVLRFFFRCTGDWTSNQNIDGGGGLKFIRLYGNGGSGDSASALLKILNDGDSTNPHMGIFDPAASTFTWYSTGINYQDGNWHSVVFKAVRNNDNNQSGNVTISFWLDDWNMDGSGFSKTITAPDFGNGFSIVGLNGNWSAQYPSNLISMDIDKVELWDGLPDGSVASPAPTPTPTPSPEPLVAPSRMSIVAWSANTQANDDSWSDSGAVWCARVLVKGDDIANTSDGNIILSFQGRSSGSYTIRKVSIAERDQNGQEGDIIDNTWSRVTFDDNSVSNWDSYSVTVPAGTVKRSDLIPFNFEKGKDYYVTFLMESPTTYLVTSNDYGEMYFDGADHADDLDWGGNGHSTYPGRLHALASVAVTP